jgi:hypothetical protein
MTDMALYVADARDLLWSTKSASTYNGFLRSVVGKLLNTRRPLREDVHFDRAGASVEDWELEARLLPGSGDAALLLRPAM